MSAPTDIKNESPQRNYYTEHNYQVESGHIPVAEKLWRPETTLWMLAFALLLWLLTYLIIITLTMCFDFGFRAITSYNGFVKLYNGSLLFEHYYNY